MPIIGTKAAASSQGFGEFALQAPATDPYWAYVTLLLGGQGTNGSTTFTDSSNSNLTASISARNADAYISTAQYKFGTSSILFNNANTGLLVANSSFASFSGDFTIEGWYYCLDTNIVNNYSCIFGQYFVGNWQIQIGAPSGSSTFGIYCNGAPGWQTVSYSMPNNSWVFLSITRSGSTIYFHGNGVYLGSATYSGTIPMSAGSGGGVGALANYWLSGYYGYLQQFRITNGIARYTSSDYSVPTAAFPTS